MSKNYLTYLCFYDIETTARKELENLLKEPAIVPSNDGFLVCFRLSSIHEYE